MAKSSGLYSIPILQAFSTALLCFLLALWDACPSWASKTWAPLLVSLMSSSSSSLISLSQPGMPFLTRCPLPLELSSIPVRSALGEPVMRCRVCSTLFSCPTCHLAFPAVCNACRNESSVYNVAYRTGPVWAPHPTPELLLSQLPVSLAQHHDHLKPFPLPIIQTQSWAVSAISSSFSLFLSNKFLHFIKSFLPSNISKM